MPARSVEQQILEVLEKLLAVSKENLAVQKEILSSVGRSRKLLVQIAEDLSPDTSTVSAGIALGGSMAAVAGTQAVGSTLTATFVPLEADGVTKTPGAVLTTPPAYTIDPVSVATIVDNGNGTATITGVSAGTATVTATGGVFTDTDGVATAPLTATNTDVVTSTTPIGRTVSAQINFS